MATVRKWKRKKAGTYTRDEWRIAGAGTKWKLYDSGELIDTFHSKKDAQAHAKREDGYVPGDASDDAEAALSDGTPMHTNSDPNSLGNVLCSLRLEISALGHTNTAQTAAITNQTAAITNLTAEIRRLKASLE